MSDSGYGYGYIFFVMQLSVSVSAIKVADLIFEFLQLACPLVNLVGRDAKVGDEYSWLSNHGFYHDNGRFTDSRMVPPT